MDEEIRKDEGLVSEETEPAFPEEISQEGNFMEENTDSEEEIREAQNLSGQAVPEQKDLLPDEKSAFRKGILSGIILIMIPVLAALAALTIYLRSHDYYIGISSKETAEFSSKISLVRQVIDKYYLFDYDEEELDDSAISSYVKSLGDPYTVYYDADEYKDLLESNSGSYTGIGVQITKTKDSGEMYFDKVFTDSPAEAAGIKTGDQLLKVNDTEVEGMELDDVVSMIKNAEDNITLTLKREDEEFSVEVSCETVEVDTVSSKMLDDHIGYIQLVQFEDVSTDQFQEAVDTLKDQGMKKLIVDLRDNPGGILNTAVDIADIFVDTGVVVTVKDKNDKEKEYKATEKGALGLPTVILVNGDSASASEVFSGCLKDYGLATLVGTQTFGKGIVQNVLPFNDGTGIKITIAHYYTPEGNDIHGVGITPDVVVEDDADTAEDEQLEKALEVIRDME